MPGARPQPARAWAGRWRWPPAPIAAGFLAFAPTDYIGVSQLGVIAGVGMLVALALNLTLLPALLALLRAAPPSHRAAPPAPLRRIDDFMLGHRRLRARPASWRRRRLRGACCRCCSFDFNPIHLRRPEGRVGRDPVRPDARPRPTPNTLEVVRPTSPPPQALGRAAGAGCPEVDSARTLADFVPADQAAKLAAIADAATLLDLDAQPDR